MNIDNAKEGGYVVALAKEEGGYRRSYIIVGKITSIEKHSSGGGTIHYKPLRCTADPWTKKCITSPWHLPSGRGGAATIEHTAVISYPSKLTSQNKLPAKDQGCIKKRKIFTDDTDDED